MHLAGGGRMFTATMDRILPALGDLPRSGRPDRLDPRIEAKILAKTQEPPPAPFTHWTTRRMGKLIGVSYVTVHRVWQRAGLQPHRLEHYVTSDDPDFERKAADVIGLYLTPPANAVVFSVDEKTAIQALDRLDARLPMSPGRAETLMTVMSRPAMASPRTNFAAPSMAP